MARKDDTKAAIREAAEADLETFIRLVHPNRVLGSVHTELIRWWQREDARSHQLVLLPRDHGKSAMVGYRAAHAIVCNPAVRILYISSTANLATKQLKFIKDILLHPTVRTYWPDLVNIDEGRREKWTETEIAVDHPKRKEEYIRDPTIFTAGLTTTVTGMHSDINILDDVVVKENAYTEEGRKKVEDQFSLLASIEGADSRQWVVGTRYHPNDLYNTMREMQVVAYDREGSILEDYPMYEQFEKQVEVDGEFLWPRQQGPKGTWFGFNESILARKYAQYLDKLQFRAQYYNDPNDPAGAGISKDNFQYFDPKHVTRVNGQWFVRQRRVNVFAAVDFAYSTKTRADYTAIVVVGIDSDNHIYVLDIDRFKTNLMSEYFSHILKMHQKWDFRKLRAEVTAAQKVIVEDLKNSYIRQHGLALTVEDFRPNKYQGAKEERMGAILQPRYANGQIWHYVGGHCQTLEEELILSNPSHDDIKDCLATAIEGAMNYAPAKQMIQRTQNQTMYHNRFGGVI